MMKSPSLRRIQADIRELALDPSDRYHAAPLENDMFEWHFTIKGAPETDFDGGIYHGRILLPPDYPFKPPHILFVTPSGRFDIHTKICLSFSAYHPELWQPAWGIRLILEALISFLPTPPDGAIGALDYPSLERKKLAMKSQQFICPHCGPIKHLIKPSTLKIKKTTTSTTQFQKEILELQRLQNLSHAITKDDTSSSSSSTPNKDETTTTIGTTITSESSQQQQLIKESNSSVIMTGTNESPTTVEVVVVADTTTTTDRNESSSSFVTTSESTEKVKPRVDVVPVPVAAVETTKTSVYPKTDDPIGDGRTTPLVVPPQPPSSNDDNNNNNPAILAANNNNNNNNIVPEERRQIEIIHINVNHANNVNNATTTTNNTNPTNQNQNHNNTTTTTLVSKVLDPLLQIVIGILAIVCCLLMRKIHIIAADIRDITEQQHAQYEQPQYEQELFEQYNNNYLLQD